MIIETFVGYIFNNEKTVGDFFFSIEIPVLDILRYLRFFLSRTILSPGNFSHDDDDDGTMSTAIVRFSGYRRHLTNLRLPDW